ncbi:hypothetical protein Esti_000220 [Eimeria stiedai]
MLEGLGLYGNGAGKSTLIALIGGQKMVQQGDLLVLGRRAFHDPSLASDVCCLNSWWGIDHAMDVRLEEIVAPSLLQSSCWVAPQARPPRGPHPGAPNSGLSCRCNKRFLCVTWRVQKLLELLQASLDWRIGFLSSGEKRRAQLVASLAEPRKVYLLDEATADLDIVSRKMLCRFLQLESLALKSCLVYSTHVFDGLDDWPTHLLYLEKGELKVFSSVSELHELQGATTAGSFFALVQRWLLSEAENKKLQNVLEDVLEGNGTSGASS